MRRKDVLYILSEIAMELMKYRTVHTDAINSSFLLFTWDGSYL